MVPSRSISEHIGHDVVASHKAGQSGIYIRISQPYWLTVSSRTMFDLDSTALVPIQAVNFSWF